MKISRLDAPRCVGGENPLWDEAGQRLHYIDNRGCKVHTLDPSSGTSRTFEMPTVVTTLALREGGGAIATLRSGICWLDLETGATEIFHPNPEPREYGYNDGKIDHRGRFIIGASTIKVTAPEPDGGLLRLDSELTLTRIADDIHFSNGPCWSRDWKTLYFADSWIKTIYAYDYDDATGTVANRRVFARTDELGGLPDGAAIDADGLLWVAIYGAGRIAAFRPDGTVERVIEMPVKLVSSLCFGGPRFDQIFVTSIDHDSTGSTSDEADAGSVFCIEGSGAIGKAEPRFAG